MIRRSIFAAALIAAALAGCARTAQTGPPQSAAVDPPAAPAPPPLPAPPPPPPPPPPTADEPGPRAPASTGTVPLPRGAPRPAIIVGAAPPPASGLPPPAASANYAVVRVFFGTNRKPTNVAGLEGRFANAPGPLSYGAVDVSVPRSHRRGVIERPGTVSGWLFSPDPRKHFTIRAFTALDRRALLREVAAKTAGSGGPGRRLAMIFVHGFNVGFDDAAFRTAQMSYDIGFRGAPLFYSWPSQHSLIGYNTDSARIETSRPLIKRFISDVIVGSRADRVIIIAHSMGTRGTTRALAELARERPEQTRKIAALILAAPDIQAETFRRDIAPHLSRMAATTTLYASSEDLALQTSHHLAGRPALGDARGGVRVFQNMVSIDATKAGTSFLGHSAYGDSPALLRDIAEIVAGRTAAAQRPWLRRRPGGHYVLELVR
ncbi:MAG TPA: alpha/beta hydrolase [Allosphingosinicella sp.]